MILCPPGWHERRSGDVLVYLPRNPPHDCVLTYAEHVAPLRPLLELANETLAEDPEFEVSRTLMITRLVTDEGEYAARVVVHGRRRGQPVAHIVGAVFADDFSTRLTARVTDLARLDDHVTLVTELLRADRLALGVRRRRFAFQPPPAWHPVPGMALDIAFFPPDYPRSHSCIVVPAAEPVAALPQGPAKLLQEIDERVGLPPGQHVRTTPIATRRNLVGEELMWTRRLPGLEREMHRYLAVLQDDRYYYTLRMDALAHQDLEQEHERFVATACSVESLPAPRATGAPPSVAAFWDD